MRHLHMPDRPDEPTSEHSARPNPDRPDRQCECGHLAPSRSVELRTEIGSTPRRDRSGSGSRSVVVQCGVVFGVGSCVSQAGQPWAGSDGARVCRGRLVLHTRAHSASAETAESCGTTLSVVGTVLLPCAQITLTAHGNPTATHHAHRKSPSFQQKPVPTPQRPQSPMCSIDNNHAHQAPPRRRPTNPPQTRAGTRPISTRTTTDLAAKMYRSRRGTGPISARVTTDLDAARNRPQGGDLAGLLQIRLHTGGDPTRVGGGDGWGQTGWAAGRPQAAQPPGAVRAARHRAAGGRPPRLWLDLHGDRQEV